MVRMSSEPAASPDELAKITDAIYQWNMDRTGVHDYHQVAIFLRDDDDEIRGGVTGGVWGTWLHIVVLWVDEDLRGRGFDGLHHSAALGTPGATDENDYSHSPAAQSYRALDLLSASSPWRTLRTVRRNRELARSYVRNAVSKAPVGRGFPAESEPSRDGTSAS